MPFGHDIDRRGAPQRAPLATAALLLAALVIVAAPARAAFDPQQIRPHAICGPLPIIRWRISASASQPWISVITIEIQNRSRCRILGAGVELSPGDDLWRVQAPEVVYHWHYCATSCGLTVPDWRRSSVMRTGALVTCDLFRLPALVMVGDLRRRQTATITITAALH